MSLLPEDERRLRRNWSLLKQELHVEDFIHHFVDLGIFPPDLRNDIMNVIPNTPGMKGEKFLLALLASGQRGYQVLCALLRRNPDNRYSAVIEALAVPQHVNMDVLVPAGQNPSSRPSTAQSSAVRSVSHTTSNSPTQTVIKTERNRQSSGTVNSETGERNRRVKPVAMTSGPASGGAPEAGSLAMAAAGSQSTVSGTPIAAVQPVVAVTPEKQTQPTTEQISSDGIPGNGDGTANATAAVFQIPENVRNSPPTVSIGNSLSTGHENSQGQLESGTSNGASDVSVDMKALEQELIRIAPTIRDLFHKIAKQTESNPTSEEDIQKVKEENERLRKTNKTLIEKLNSFQQKIIQLQLDNKRLRECSDLGQVKKKELQQKTDELQEMERRLNEHKKALEEKEMELNIQLNKLKDIEEENEFQRIKIDKLEELQDEGIYERNIQQEQISCLVEEKEKQRDQIDSLEEQQKMGEQRLYRLEERLKMLEQGPSLRRGQAGGRGRRLVSPPRNPAAAGSPGNMHWMNGIVDRSHHSNIKFQADSRGYGGGAQTSRELGKRGQTKTGWPLL